MNHNSRRASACQRRRKKNAPSRNPSHNLAQTNLADQNLAELDTKAFGDEFPFQPGSNYCIITFQNTGQMSKFTTQPKSIQIIKAHKNSNASVALYAEYSLNET